MVARIAAQTPGDRQPDRPVRRVVGASASLGDLTNLARIKCC